MAASISTIPPGQKPDPPGRTDVYNDGDDANVNSILAVVSDVGTVHYFLDGSYSLGSTAAGTHVDPISLYKHPLRPIFYAHSKLKDRHTATTSLLPTIFHCPLLNRRWVRDMAILSTIVKDLSWYLLRVVKEMRTSWFGSDMSIAAREIGPKWVRALEVKQANHVARKSFYRASFD